MNISDLIYLENCNLEAYLILGGVSTTANAWSYAGYQNGSADSSASAYGENTFTDAQAYTTTSSSNFHSQTHSSAQAYSYANTGNDSSSSSADSQSWSLYTW